MQLLKRLEFGKPYSINGNLCVIEQITSYGGALRGVQTVWFKSANGVGYKATQWTDGAIYRVLKSN